MVGALEAAKTLKEGQRCVGELEALPVSLSFSCLVLYYPIYPVVDHL
jgi:hypothetical protein